MSTRSPVHDLLSPCWDGPSPGAGPEYARHPDLEAFATDHAIGHHVRNHFVAHGTGAGHGTGIEALANDLPHKQETHYSKYAQNLRGALKRIRIAATEAIVEEDIFGLETEALVSPPGSFDFSRDSEKEAAFREWLDRQLEDDILTEWGGENTYISSSYQRAITDADSDLRRAFREHDVDLLDVPDADTPAASVVRSGIHEDAMQDLFERNFRALEGFTDELGSDLSRELLDGFSQGEGPRDIATRIRDTVGKASDGRHTGYTGRATTIARTEVMNAHHVATTKRYEEFGVTQVEPLLSPGACDQCVDLSNEAPWSPEEARGLYPAHPSCVCALTIAT
ncbi:hypothetical protein [Natronorarus salvus]|uniref:hypothetical protein n=1 Tax=Natronorarus salvus TaxID=3117733 RepID=UPI002F25F53D